MSRSEYRRLETVLQEFAYWKGRRDELIRAGLAAGIPVERLAAVMDVSESTVRRVRRLTAPGQKGTTR